LSSDSQQNGNCIVLIQYRIYFTVVILLSSAERRGMGSVLHIS